MKLSETAKTFIGHCWKNEMPCNISVWFKKEYVINNKMCKLDDSIWNEIKSSGLVKVIHEQKEYVTFGGIGEIPL